MRSHLVATDSIRAVRFKGDRIITAVCACLWLTTLGFAPIYDTWLAWVLCANFLLAVTLLLTWLIPGTRGSRIGIGLCLMGFPGLTVYQTHGLPECHFGYFILLGLLVYYRDWRPIFCSSLLIGLYLVLMVWLQLNGHAVYLFPNTDHPLRMVAIHIAFTTLEAITLIFLTLIIRLEALESSAIAAFGERIITTGTLDLTFDSERHRGAAARGLTNLLNAVLGVSRRSDTLATRISHISEEIATSSAHMVTIAEDKIRATADIMESVHSMSEATGQIKTDCAAVAQVASQSATIVSEGCATMQQTAALMLTVSETASSTVSEIKQLQCDSARVESIVEIMNDMANQSALLALNASIEAARAGEKGRGFQVVAQEIRTLSERSYQSLAEVQSIVETIRLRVDQLETHADRCKSAATIGGTQVSAAHRALTEVSAHLPHVADRVVRVLQATDHQTQVSREVVTGMTLIGEAMERIAGDVRGVAALSNSLEQISEELSANVRQFHHEDQIEYDDQEDAEAQPLQPILVDDRRAPGRRYDELGDPSFGRS